ncbi:MAG: hypothetical protein AAFN65_11400, partial [Bacteroidota bacterium]
MIKKYLVFAGLFFFFQQAWTQCPVINSVEVNYDGDCGGQATIVVSATDGEGGFSLLVYSIGGGYNENLSGVFTNVDPGEYFLTVEDPSTGCITIYEENPIVIEESSFSISSVSTTNPSGCGLSDGEIVIILGGGGSDNESRGISPDIRYSISGPSGPWQFSNTFPDLGAGDYDVWAENIISGCQINWGPVVLEEPTPPQFLDINSTNTTCGEANGSITILASGSSSIEYSITGPSGPWQSTGFFDNLFNGFYNPYIRYSNQTCVTPYGSNIFISPSSAPVITNISQTNVSDCGDNDGSITITAVPGAGSFLPTSFEYSINGPSGPWQDNNFFPNLSAGIYDIWVQFTDNTCPVSGGSIVITQPTQPAILDIATTNDTNCSSNNGTIEITAAEGQGTYQYSISGPSGPWNDSNLFEGLGAGTYSIWVRNSNSTCPVSGDEVTLTGVTAPFVENVSGSNSDNCENPNGSIIILAVGVS